jgi:hypothetical protein
MTPKFFSKSSSKPSASGSQSSRDPTGESSVNEPFNQKTAVSDQPPSYGAATAEISNQTTTASASVAASSKRTRPLYGGVGASDDLLRLWADKAARASTNAEYHVKRRLQLESRNHGYDMTGGEWMPEPLSATSEASPEEKREDAEMTFEYATMVQALGSTPTKADAYKILGQKKNAKRYPTIREYLKQEAAQRSEKPPSHWTKGKSHRSLGRVIFDHLNVG